MIFGIHLKMCLHSLLQNMLRWKVVSAMNTRGETIAIPDNEAKASAGADAWCRIWNSFRTPYVPVAALALIAVAASAVWFTVGGSWWFPVCVAVSAVSMIAVWGAYTSAGFNARQCTSLSARRSRHPGRLRPEALPSLEAAPPLAAAFTVQAALSTR